MKLHIKANGTLIFQISGDDRDNWLETRDERGYVAIEEIFADSDIPGNSDFEILRPEEIGALTDSPIFGQGAQRDDDGTLLSVENVWWFPNYQIADPAETLLETGSVAFTPAPENATQNQAA